MTRSSKHKELVGAKPLDKTGQVQHWLDMRRHRQRRQKPGSADELNWCASGTMAYNRHHLVFTPALLQGCRQRKSDIYG